MSAEVGNPMADSVEGGHQQDPLTRLGDELVQFSAECKTKGRTARARGAATEEDDGGEETLEHFLDDVFGQWMAPDGAQMDIEQVTTWSQNVLGVDLAPEELKDIFEHVVGCHLASADHEPPPAGITMAALKNWWMEDAGGSITDQECDFRRALRLRGIFTAARASLLVLADPTESHLATRRLFQRINVVCDFHKEARDRITLPNLKVLCDDLGIEVSDTQLKVAVNEMDSSKKGNVFVSFHPFEEWWLHGAGMDRDSHESVSTVVHSMLRLCGLLSCAQHSTVFGVWNSATSILSSEEMRVSVEKALDKIATNANHHHFDHMIEKLHLASLGGLLHREESFELMGSSLKLFDPESRLRQTCHKLVTSIQFEFFILACILINIVALVMYTETTASELEADADRLGVSDFFVVINTAVALIFTLEMSARMIAFGAVDGEHAYVKNGWNCFDGFVVMSIWMLTIVSAFTSINSSVAFILTAFRAFRSFRFFEGTRQIIQTFVKARETLGLVTALMLVFFVMFAVIGREIFAGALTRSCRPFLDEIPIWTNASLVGLNATAMNCGDSSAGSHRRQLGGGATKGDLREIYGAEGEIAESFWIMVNGTVVNSSLIHPWFTEGPSNICPLTLSCVESCWSIKPINGPKWREHHIDKYGFDDLPTSLMTIFQVTARDEWMRMANPIYETSLSTSWVAWPFFATVMIVMGLMCVNLFLASITLSYLDLQKELRQEAAIQAAHEALIAALLVQGGGSATASRLISDELDEELLPLRLTGARGWCQRMIEGQRGVKFNTFILIVVALNTIAMAVEHHEMPESLESALYIMEAFFTIIYVFEASVKIGGLGFNSYISSNLNRLDFFIVITAILGYFLEFVMKFFFTASAGSSDAQSGTAFRLIRIFRVVRAARAMRVGKILIRSKAITQIIGMAFASWSPIISLLFMVFLTVVVASISGIFLFQPCHASSSNTAIYTRGNYGDLASAILANFQLFTEDNWANIMYEYIECMETKWVALYFTSLFTALDFILLVVFVSVFLDNFTLSEEAKRKKQVDLYLKNRKAQDQSGIGIMDLKSVNMAVRLVYSGGSSVLGFLRLKNLQLQDDESWNPARSLPEGEIDRIVEFDSRIRKFAQNGQYGDTVEFPPLSEAELSHVRAVAWELNLHFHQNSRPAELNQETGPKPGRYVGVALKIAVADDVACGCFPPEHPLRLFCYALANHWVFEGFVLSCIALSGVALAIEGPTNYHHDDSTKMALQLADLIFYFAFLLECLAKIIALGFAHTPNAYLKQTTNAFDFFVVIVTTVDLILWLANVNYTWITLVRLMRSLRLIRLVERVEGLNVMAMAIWNSLPACAAIGGLLLGNMLMFSIVGMNLYMGQLYYCKGHKDLDRKCPSSGCLSGVEYCDVHYPGMWKKYTFNFNNLYESFGSLFVLTTRQGWHELFYHAVDVYAVDMAPRENANRLSASIFFITFIVINGFMLEELFIGMLVEIFSQTSGTVLLTETQKKWRYLQMYVYHFSETHPDPPADGGLRRTCFDLVTHHGGWFQKVMVSVVVGNVAMLVYDEAAHMRRLEGRDMLDFVNDICVLVFTIEIAVESLAFGALYLKRNFANVCVVVGLWIVCIHAHAQHHGLNDASLDWIQLLQCLRVVKLFEVLSHFSALKKLVHTLRLALPQAANIIMLMTMSYFLFGIIAMKLYGDIDYLRKCNTLQWIGETNNFHNIWHSMKLLFQITTGNPLPLLIEDLRHEAALPGTIIPFIFFFFVISNFVLLNVFIALLLENFEYNLEGEFAIEEVDVELFKSEWDHSALVIDGRLRIRSLLDFMLNLDGPLSVVVDTDPFWYNRMLLELDVEANDELEGIRTFEFHEVMLALCKMRFGNSCLPFELEIEAEEKLRRRHHQTAARLIQVCASAWRMGRTPPATLTEDEIRKWRITVSVARFWVMTVAIKKSRISASRFKTAHELEASKSRTEM